MAAPLYSTPEMVRDRLGVDETTLPDDRAVRLILAAEDAIDVVLGPRPVDAATGRKVMEADVEPWQWERLQRAATELAARAFTDPQLLGGQRWQEVAGPDFRFRGPLSGGAPDIAATVAGLGLARRTGRVR